MAYLQYDKHEPVAIVGMGCRWPGGVRDGSQFWTFLRDRVDGWKEFGHPHFYKRGFYHPNSDRPGSVAMKGAFLAQEDARLFDYSFFGMTRLEVETLDPSQRKLLEVAYEAIENAGESWESISGSKTGVFVGNFCLDHWMIQSRDWDNPRPYAFTGAGTSILANRISYVFNLQGPSLTVDTACSSSMYALHLAVNAIRAGDCDSAIVASANWIADPGVQIALDKLGALSASSRCHTFDARAEGYARGEGYGAIYLKRSSLAVADNSPIRAMIRGTAINSNGRTGGITRPSARGQEVVIREAYRNAGGLAFQDTSYFECHGTGTYVGDPIEVAAVGSVFASGRSPDDPLLVGSVKSNVGHGEGASALASIMKVVLSLENQAIPPIFNLETRNPNIDFDGANVQPVIEVAPWPQNRLQRASVNSFGYGGANGHCIIDHVNNVLPDYVAPGVYKSRGNGTKNGYTNGHCNGKLTQHHPIVNSPRLTATTNTATRRLVLLPLSAHNEHSLKSNTDALSRIIGTLSLADVAYTLGARRSRFAHRYFCIVDKDNVAQSLEIDGKIIRAPLQTVNIGFIFTGQGAQWHKMGAELFEYRVFRTAIECLDNVLGILPDPPSWSLRSILQGECDEALIQTAEIAQVVCTAIQIGLVDLLASWSVRPAGVAGHSSGEIAAAYASGRITAAEAIVSAYLRGQAVSRNQKDGAMLAVGLGPDQVAKYLEGHEEEVKLAAINSPGSVTLSGETGVIDKISAAMIADSIFNRKLKTDGNAYHSHHMIPIGHEYIEMLAKQIEYVQDSGLAFEQERYHNVLWVSSVTPGKSTGEFDNPAAYWRANLESPVLFSDAVASLVNREDVPIHALVEIGPHPALKSPVEQILKAGDKAVAYASTLKRQEDGLRSMLQLAGTLFRLNATIDLAAVNAVDEVDGTGLKHGCTCTSLPPYRYTYGELNYYESRASKEYRYRSVLKHDLLGSKVVGNAKLRPQWRNILRMKDVPWLGDHRLVPDAVLPGAAYIAMAVEAASRTYEDFHEPLEIKGFHLSDVVIKRSLVIPEDDYGVEVLTSMELVDVAAARSPAWATFSISSVGRETDEWIEHSTGRVKVEVEAANEDDVEHQVTPHAPRDVDARAWYKKFLDIGLGYGPAFQPLSSVRTDPASSLAVATVALHPTTIKGGESRYALHPASLDGAIQLGLIACHAGQPDEASTAFVPVQISRMYLANGTTEDTCTAVAHGERRGVRGAYLDLRMLGPHGEVLLNVDTLRCTSYSSQAKPVDRAFSSPFTRLVWKPDIRTLNNRQTRQLYPPPKVNVEKSTRWGITNKLAHFVVLSIYESFGKLQEGPKPSGDVGYFFSWIKRKAQADASDWMQEARKLASAGLLLEEIEKLVAEAPDVVEVKITKLLHDKMADILYERRSGMDVIISEDLLTPLYQSGLLMTSIYPQFFHILAGLAHSNPNLRILEIGGGTGGATRVAMKALKHPNGIKAYRDYTFTDISPGFLSSARESMADLHDMSFSVFDIEVDPMEQGYEQAYDLIVACQVLHATSNMHRTLSNCRKLLRPGGRLVLVETNQNFIVPGVVVGTFTGYWAGIPDGRVDAPFQSLEAWDFSLREAGFSGLDVVLDDFPQPHNTTSVILSTVLPEVTKSAPTSTIHVLYGSERAPRLVEQVYEELQQRGVIAKISSFEEALVSLAPESHVIAFFDEKHLLVNTNDHSLRTFQHFARSAASLVALTSCGTAKGRNADGALIPGLLRVLRNESPASQYASIDIDADNFEVYHDVGDLARCIVDREFELHEANSMNDVRGNPRDLEFSWQDDCMWVSRHVPDAGFHSQHGLDRRGMTAELLPLSSQGPVKAMFEMPGVLNSLCFTSYKELLQPLQPGFIDVAVAAIGVNQRDVDHWTGRLDDNHLSSEYAGIVSKVGAGVGSFKVGDRVYGLGKGQFGSYTRVPAAFVCKLQPGDDMTQMATMPLAYATAIYAFDYVAHLRKGQTALIQSGAKDAGLASICLAKAKGADVFATVDTTEQANFLVNELAIPASHVIATPSLSALRRTAQTTSKGNFDVIISTTRDELSRSFQQVLAPLGYLIDVGRANKQNHPTISSDFFRSNTSYCSIDPFAILDSDPGLGTELMRAVDSYYRNGLIGPIQRVTAPHVSQLSAALGNFADMVGKLVARFDDTETLVRMIPSAPTANFDSESCYVITGALGGLGQSLIRLMGDRGARHLALLSRRNISNVPEALKLVESLAGRGIRVESFVCDVSKIDQVMRVIRQISSSRPIKGIVHAAVSYLDLTFDQVSSSRWNQSLSAKVDGTKNLHEATISMPLDFFVMTTSALSVYAFATQGAYTAANNFQDAFARHRRRMGLAASTISFSLVREITNVGTNAITVDLFERNKTLTLSESQFLTLLEPAFLNNRTSDNIVSEQQLGQQEDPLSAANLHTYLDPAGMASRDREQNANKVPSSNILPRWYSDGRISLIMRSFSDAQRQSAPLQNSPDERSKNAVTHTRTQFDAAIRDGISGRTSTVALVQGAIINMVAEMLFVDIESIDPAKSMADLGVDSLVAAELRNWFLQALGANISMLDLLEPSVGISTRAASITDEALAAKV
ncbi:beta-ketoacyl synthase domain-containing protein [Hypoxylon cercidicola]|nr:beta-ketoacyl synthase domain-containing protein [Hypoxylon cercidicola]